MRKGCCPVFSEEKPTFRVGLWTFFLKVIPHSCLWQTCCARQYALRAKKDSIISLPVSRPFCPSVLGQIFRRFVDRRSSSISLYPVGCKRCWYMFTCSVDQGSRRQRHSDFCLADTHGWSILHTGFAGAYGRYGATEKVRRKRNE